MKINIERLLDSVTEYYAAYGEYARVTTNHISADNDKLNYLFRQETETLHNVLDICDILVLNNDQKDRLYKAAKVYRRWQEKTGYENFMPEKMVDQFYKYIFEVESKRRYYSDKLTDVIIPCGFINETYF